MSAIGCFPVRKGSQWQVTHLKRISFYWESSRGRLDGFLFLWMFSKINLVMKNFGQEHRLFTLFCHEYSTNTQFHLVTQSLVYRWDCFSLHLFYAVGLMSHLKIHVSDCILYLFQITEMRLSFACCLDWRFPTLFCLWHTFQMFRISWHTCHNRLCCWEGFKKKNQWCYLH